MKQVLLGCVFLLVLSCPAVNAQTMIYRKGGEIRFEGKTLKKPREIAPLIEQKENPDLTNTFNNYKSNRGFANVLGFVGGFGVGWALSGVIGGGKLNGGLLAGGVAAIGVGGLLSSSANKSLQQMVELYNGSPGSALYLTPIIRAGGYSTEVGVSIGF